MIFWRWNVSWHNHDIMETFSFLWLNQVSVVFKYSRNSPKSHVTLLADHNVHITQPCPVQVTQLNPNSQAHMMDQLRPRRQAQGCLPCLVCKKILAQACLLIFRVHLTEENIISLQPIPVRILLVYVKPRLCQLAQACKRNPPVSIK